MKDSSTRSLHVDLSIVVGSFEKIKDKVVKQTFKGLILSLETTPRMTKMLNM